MLTLVFSPKVVVTVASSVAIAMVFPSMLSIVPAAWLPPNPPDPIPPCPPPNCSRSRRNTSWASSSLSSPRPRRSLNSWISSGLIGGTSAVSLPLSSESSGVWAVGAGEVGRGSGCRVARDTDGVGNDEMSAVGAPAGELPSPADPHATAKATTRAIAIAASGLFMCEFPLFDPPDPDPVSGFGTGFGRNDRTDAVQVSDKE